MRKILVPILECRRLLLLLIMLLTLPNFLQAAGPSLGWTNAVKQATEELYEKRKQERPNTLPNTPANPFPPDGATGQSINVGLSWTGGDPDSGDTVTYDVYFEANDSNPDVLVSPDQTGTTYDPGTLSYDTHYYWKIIATDNHAASTEGSVWDFYTGSKPNSPPNTPTNPSPSDGATGQSITVDLSWTGGDPDSGDTVTYDVYFEANDSSPDVLVSNDQSGTTYDPGTLNYNTHYYWKIIATDNHGASTTGPVWDFITGPAPIQQEMVLIPAGNFTMGSDLGYGNEKPVHRVYLDAYYIDKYEVTNAMYKQFIDAGGYNNSSYWTTDGWNWKISNSITQPGYWTDTTFGYGSGRENLPVVGVSWYEAYAYAKWAGKRLPTEAEWEKAARGTDARTYPWGDTWYDNYCNWYDGSSGDGSQDGYQYTAPVGNYESGKSPYGCYDMAGNVWEWCNDWYQSDYYNVSPTNNPQGPSSGSGRVLRGGSWSVAGYCRSAIRCWLYPDAWLNGIGFRCAR